jgi:hypothetical protein
MGFERFFEGRRRLLETAFRFRRGRYRGRRVPLPPPEGGLQGKEATTAVDGTQRQLRESSEGGGERERGAAGASIRAIALGRSLRGSRGRRAAMGRSRPTRRSRGAKTAWVGHERTRGGGRREDERVPPRTLAFVCFECV